MVTGAGTTSLAVGFSTPCEEHSHAVEDAAEKLSPLFRHEFSRCAAPEQKRRCWSFLPYRYSKDATAS